MKTLSHTAEVPVASLTLSPLNVRPASERGDIEGLAANIKSRGLLQNLGIVPAERSPSGLNEVVFGGRRLAAIHLLLEKKDIDDDTMIACTVVSAADEEAISSSLSENTLRKSMSAVSEFEAFAALAEAGASVSDIARDYHCTEQHVRQRLRLGKAAPAVRDALRKGKISLDVAKAFCACDDQERQKTVFDALQAGHFISPYRVREMLFEDGLKVSAAIVDFVGLDAYREAGGDVTADLFVDDAGYCEDRGLLERLATEKLARVAQEYSDNGWGWVEASLDRPEVRDGLVKLKGTLVEPSDEEKSRLETARNQLDELVEKSDDEWTEDDDDKYDRLEAEIEKLAAPKYSFSEEQKSAGGAVIYFDDMRGLVIEEGLIQPESVRAGSDCEATDAHQENGKKQKPIYSKALDDDLAIYKAIALQAALVKTPAIASRFLIFCLACDLLDTGFFSDCLNVSARHGFRDTSQKDAVSTPGGAAVASFKDKLNLDWLLEKTHLARWRSFVELSDREIELITTFVAAKAVTPRQRNENGRDTPTNAVAEALNVDIRASWTPTDLNFWSRMTKAFLIQTIKDVLGEDEAANCAGLKKDALVRKLHDAFNGEQALSEDQRDKVASWLPPEFAFVGYDAPNTDPDETSVDGQMAA